MSTGQLPSEVGGRAGLDRSPGSACRLAAREADTVGVTVNLVREDY